MSNRKRKNDEEWSNKKTKAISKDEESLRCIIHSKKLSNYGNFTSLDHGTDTPKKKLEHLHTIRNRRLLEDANSMKRMQDVCDMIPESVEDLDTKKAGWHRGCYQQFTKNLDRLKPAVMLPLASPLSSPEPCSSLVLPHSPRKPGAKRSLVKSAFLFPTDRCLFCDKKTIKKHGEKGFPTEAFSDWSHKSSGWKNIEEMAAEMQNNGYSSLLRKVAGVDLFATEACFHKSCYCNFYSKYQTFTGYHQSTTADTKETRKCCRKHMMWHMMK